MAFPWWRVAAMALGLCGTFAAPAVEVVLCRCREDVSWISQLGYDSLTTAYSKCGAPAVLANEVPSRNVGREGGTFLQHIVDRYDTLADWTVFSQAEKPTYGYMGHRLGGGHMMSSARFTDYITASQHAQERPRFFIFSAAAVIEGDKSFAQAMRRGFGDAYSNPSGDVPSQCGTVDDFQTWFAYPAWFKDMIADLQKSQDAPFVGVSASKVFHLFDATPQSNVIFFAQGSRFAASRTAIQSRPRAYYQRLLELMNHEDPWAGYFLELLWWYVIGGSAAPCGYEDDIAEMHLFWRAKSRFVGLQQVSGAVSGSIDLSTITAAVILAMTDAQRKAYFVDRATTGGTVTQVNDNYGGLQVVLFIPVPGTLRVVTSDSSTNGKGVSVFLALIPCASSADTSQCEEAAAIITICPKKPEGIGRLFSSGAACASNVFVGCSIIRMRKDGSIISASYLTTKMSPCPTGCTTAATDGSYCLNGNLGKQQSDGGCECTVTKTSVVSGSSTTNTSSGGGSSSNTGLFYIIFVLMIIPIALLIAACLYYYFYHYKPARESEQYLAPCCAAPGYAYPPQMLTTTPALPVQYI